MERDYLRRLHGAGDSEHYNGESEVFDKLVLIIVGEDLADWFQGDRFFSLSGYNADVWQVVVLKATQGATASLTEADPDARLYPWEAVREFLRFGYVLRCATSSSDTCPSASTAATGRRSRHRPSTSAETHTRGRPSLMWREASSTPKPTGISDSPRRPSCAPGRVRRPYRNVSPAGNTCVADAIVRVAAWSQGESDGPIARGG